MSVFKVQRIRSCTQCGVVLGLKCKACVAHPERKPRVVEYHNWPPILKTCECSCAVLIRCQRTGCTGTMWRGRTHNRNGLSRSAALFCTRRCNLIALNATKDTRVEVKCGWHACGQKILRRAAQLQTFKNAYCRPDHYFLAMRKAAHDAREAARRDANATDVGLLYCAKCRDVQEHATPKTGPATCGTCGARRTTPSLAVGATATPPARAA